MTTQKTRREYLALYAEGWTKGDPCKIMAACAPSYQMHDPEFPLPILLTSFVRYFRGLLDAAEAAARHEGLLPTPPFMELTEVVTQDDGTTLTAWCWWRIPGNGLEGSGLIKVTDQGVLSEKLAYHIAL